MLMPLLSWCPSQAGRLGSDLQRELKLAVQEVQEEIRAKARTPLPPPTTRKIRAHGPL